MDAKSDTLPVGHTINTSIPPLQRNQSDSSELDMFLYFKDMSNFAVVNQYLSS